MVKWLRQNSLYLLLIGCILVVGLGAWVLGTFSTESTPKPIAAETDTIPPNEADEVVEVTAPPAETVVEPVVVSMPEIVTPPAVEVQAPKVVAYRLPLNGKILREYAADQLLYSETMGDWRTHMGLDFAADIGTAVVAVADGTISDVFYDKLQGITVWIQHADGCTSRYANLDSLETVQKGQKVLQGDVIGAVGETALFEMSDAPHLHFELVENDVPINPKEKLPILP